MKATSVLITILACGALAVGCAPSVVSSSESSVDISYPSGGTVDSTKWLAREHCGDATPVLVNDRLTAFSTRTATYKCESG